MPDAETLVLFDIDGTLLDTRGAGLTALTQAFARSFPEQAADMPELDLAGATDAGLLINESTATLWNWRLCHAG